MIMKSQEASPSDSIVRDPNDSFRLVGYQSNVHGNIPMLREEPHSESQIVSIRVEHSFFVDQNVLSMVRSEQVGQEPLKSIVLALPFRTNGMKVDDGRRQDRCVGWHDDLPR
jgi:hypothetical protein